MWPFRKKYATVSATEARDLIRAGATLIDVRSRGEWNGGHAREARHIPLDQVSSMSASLPKNTPIVTICKSGVRSALAARSLAAQGFEVSNVRGGMHAWNRSD